MNLTAVRSEEEIVTRHFGESLFAARLLFPDRDLHGQAEVTAPSSAANRSGTRLADLGSGAGFPGLPIKLWAPGISLTLVEANQKKSTFLREVVRALELKDVAVENVRAETLRASTFDVVTVRAVERFSDRIPTAVGLVARPGRVCFMISSSQVSALSNPAGLIWRAPVATPLSEERVVVIGDIQ